MIATGAERDLDIGDVDGRAFIGIASLGFDSDANRIANAAPSRLGNLAYVYGGLRALARWHPARFELRLDGEPLHLAGYSVAACNAPYYGGGMHLAPAPGSTTAARRRARRADAQARLPRRAARRL